MKKLILLCLVAIFSGSILAAPMPEPDSSVKILQSFHHDFPNVSNEKIYKTGDTYMVYFKNEKDNSSGRVYYNSYGSILETFRYYSGTDLSPFIRSKINEKYKGNNISSVTEVTNTQEHFYRIIIEDSQSLYIIHADEKGALNLVKKFKKA